MTAFPVIEPFQVKKPTRRVHTVFIHCSASDNPAHDNAGTIDRWHRERGFREIGYHYFITKAGIIQQGRDVAKIPAAQKGHNTGSIAICLHGLKKDKFTREQRAALRSLCLYINKLYNGSLRFRGHCEVEPDKTCPVFNYAAWLKLDARGRMTQTI